jgi:hypothetical protein
LSVWSGHNTSQIWEDRRPCGEEKRREERCFLGRESGREQRISALY